MQKSQKSVFASLSKTLRVLARNGDIQALRAYSPKFCEGLAALSPKQVDTVLRLHAEARIACEAKRPPLIKRGDGSRRHWDAAKIARFQQTWLKAGSDEEAARLLGMSKPAVILARRRHPIEPATVESARAA